MHGLTPQEQSAFDMFAKYPDGLTLPMGIMKYEILLAAQSLKEKDLLIIEPIDAMNFNEQNDLFNFRVFKWVQRKLDRESQSKNMNRE